MKNIENKIQHFIPKCYLKNFSPNNKNIFIYDKIKSKPFRNTIDRIAYEDFFYELPKELVENIKKLPFETQFFEKAFFANNIEKLYGKLLENIIKKGEAWLNHGRKEEILTQLDKEILAQLIAIQYLRMPNIREKYSDATKKGLDCEVDIIKAYLMLEKPELKKEIKNLQIEYNKDFDPILHAEIYVDEELFLGIANQILNKHWIYFITNNNDFYTSDNPIIIKPHVQNQGFYYEGFGMYGAEIIFPISSNILLTMWDINYFKEPEGLPDTFNHLTSKRKREYNSIQYLCANKQTYSYNNDFNLILLLLEANGGKEFFQKKSKIYVNGK